jgi:hypothetical protein
LRIDDIGPQAARGRHRCTIVRSSELIKNDL